ncbi:MAG: TIGR01777 family oxidoreductase [Bacteroidota bacterium]
MGQCILIGGGSGLIGTRLTEILLQKGHQVRHLGRKAGTDRSGQVKTFAWDIHRQAIDEHAFDGVDVVINLAGANINGHRWTKSYKEELLVSRTGSTQLIVNAVKQRSSIRFIAGSAIGYYGFGDSTQVFKETDAPGNDFMAQLTVEWEKVADQVKNVTHIRTGIVISSRGGALEEMAKPIKLYVGSPLGSGKQVVSWIHMEDEVGIIIHVIENNLSGIFNAVAPQPATNEEMTKEIAKKLHKPLLLPNVPGFVLKIILGQMSEAVVNGSRVSSEKIESTGYKFQYPTIESALSASLHVAH